MSTSTGHERFNHNRKYDGICPRENEKADPLGPETTGTYNRNGVPSLNTDTNWEVLFVPPLKTWVFPPEWQTQHTEEARSIGITIWDQHQPQGDAGSWVGCAEGGALVFKGITIRLHKLQRTPHDALSNRGGRRAVLVLSGSKGRSQVR